MTNNAGLGVDPSMLDEDFTVEDHADVKRRTREILMESMDLADLRKLFNLTQIDLAERLHKPQNAVSRIENQNDMHISTLASYIEALGGKLSLTAEIPGTGEVQLNFNARLDRHSIEVD